MGGAAGSALLYGYAARSGAFPDVLPIAEAHLEVATNGLQELRLGSELYGGFPGIGWAVEHLDALVSGAEAIDEDDALSELDDAVLELVRARPWSRPYDLASGLVGLAVFALDRLPRSKATACLVEVVAHLENLARETPSGLTWPTPPTHLPPWQRETAPDGYLNLGVAHGISAIVAVTAQMAARGILPERARRLAVEGSRWLLAQQLDAPGRRLPAWIVDGVTPHPSRSAWCYGDPGALLAMLTAARSLSEAATEKVVLALARESAQLPYEETQADEPGLCHGAAGLGHIYNRFFQATGDAVFRDAALTAFDEALRMRRRDAPLAGFWSYQGSPSDPHDRAAPDPSVLTGAAGVALALLAATTSLEPQWDRSMLASLPPRPARDRSQASGAR